MMKVFLDTNIIIDYLSRRMPFFELAAVILQLGKSRKCELLVSSLSFATASFILQAHYKKSHGDVVKLFAIIAELCNITTVDSHTVHAAILSDFKDFEDAMQYDSAIRASADVIITRNKQDFKASELPVFEPAEFIDHYKVP